ncbi:MAG: hypothetical protein NT141_02625 [candidate division WWE3 bacterium]|nr:hypothetical protein [candidate division WWE3 bacterium]
MNETEYRAAVLDKAKRFLEGYKKFQSKDTNKRDFCKSEWFSIWNCCDYHRELDRELGGLHYIAENLLPQYNGSPFSAAWWKEFAKKFGLAVPSEFVK